MQCRVCLDCNSKCYKSLFVHDGGIAISQIIQYCADVLISEDDDLPSQACTKCCEEAMVAFTFVKKCRQSDSELRVQQVLEKQKQPATNSSPYSETIPGQSYQEPIEPRPTEDGVEILHELVDVPFQDGFSKEEEFPVEYLEQYDDTEDEINVIPDAEIQSFPLNDLAGSVSSSFRYCCYGDCMLKFVSKDELNDHMHSQHQAQDDAENSVHSNHRCDNCDRCFSSAQELCTHQRLLQLKRALIRPLTAKGRPKKHPCLFSSPIKKCCDCYASFSTIESLLAHTDQQHSVRRTVHDSTRPVRCEICYKLFQHEANLRRHQHVAYKPRNYSCGTCGACFVTPSQLATHEHVHADERKHTCQECGASFKKEQNLKMHSLLHREKQEVCKICGLRFHRKSNLRMHQRVHSDAYYSVCPHCGKQCKNRSRLSEHLKVHTKDKSLECRYCSKRFAYCTDRKRHEMSHTGDYPFVCGCAKKFTRNAPFLRHRSKCQDADKTKPNEINGEI
ncbi:zinc finger protein 154-like [Anopheles nili]|uniref:zinc finger protein 154-like n=1 Tax=Anopheles nili TaxID=185578 RepID=UPI00237A2757|nr:zinc finger protein 154-like [Anopheles nili]